MAQRIVGGAYIAILLAVLLSTMGCMSGNLGSRCESERDCDYGLGCVAGGGVDGICTVACPCDQGVCVELGGQELCLRECATSADCSAGRCQATSDGQTVCWGDAQELTAISETDGTTTDVSELPDVPDGPGPVVVARVELDDAAYVGNGDGVLNPGERVLGILTARNDGTAAAEAVHASLSALEPNVTIYMCMAVSAVQSSVCGPMNQARTECECSGMTDYPSSYNDALQTLEPGESVPPLFRFEFELDESAPASPVAFDVVFRDGNGNEWSDNFTLEVAQ